MTLKSKILKILSLMLLMFAVFLFGFKYSNFIVFKNDDLMQSNLKFKKNNLYKGLVAFGSARLQNTDPHYKEIEEISKLCANRIIQQNKKISFITGGGPGVMTAWLKNAHKLKVQTSGMNIKLPREQKLNEYILPELSYTFKEFGPRKMQLINNSKAIIVFKGGFGTMDELFEVLTLMATKKIDRRPILVYPGQFYKDVLNFKEFFKDKTINEKDVEGLKIFDKKEDLVNELYQIIDNA